ncbi:hypothetical protein [Mycobacterium paragordonae]|uniref:Uncharacterized protein n=1 Tax=Mycobacterium paragordonae TaxID=1389713 RepID=A0AAJ1W979_9MYCO|nr:hypothetical protein [Mycobacterium paragordonae]MDP7739489.1 hypothetical protein [Mycobacterium paragordonae]
MNPVPNYRVKPTRTSTTRLDLVVSLESEAIARDLAERETGCCSFFRFDFDHVEDGLVMRIGVRKDHIDVLDALQARIFALVGVKTVHDDVREWEARQYWPGWWQPRRSCSGLAVSSGWSSATASSTDNSRRSSTRQTLRLPQPKEALRLSWKSFLVRRRR